MQAPAAPPVVPTPVVPVPVASPFPVTNAPGGGDAAAQPVFGTPAATSSPFAAPADAATQGQPAATDAPSGADPVGVPAGHFGNPFPPAAPAEAGSPTFAPPPAAQPAQPAFGNGASASTASGLDFETMALRERSAIASEALSELSALSGYRPQAVESRSQGSMPRRTPQATPGIDQAAEAPSAVPHRERSATDVRSMLSGFRAGVERGRADKPSDADS
jgi:hypothetical protein